MSFVNLAANVVVCAFIPITMLLSLIAGLAGMWLPALAGWVSWPASMVLTYILDAAHILASIPGIFKENVYLSGWWMIGLYGLVIAVNIVLYRRLRRDRVSLRNLKEEHTLLFQSGTSRSSLHVTSVAAEAAKT